MDLKETMQARAEIEELLMLVEEFRGRIHPMNSHPGYMHLPETTKGRLIQLSAQAHTVTEDLDRVHDDWVGRVNDMARGSES